MKAISSTWGLTALVMLGCAALGGEGGGAENLPNRGFAPYRFHLDEAASEDEEPARTAVAPLPEGDGRVLDEPFAFNLPSGDIMLLAELEDTVVAATSRDGISFSPFETLITPEMDAARFEGHVGAPSMINLDGVLILAFEYGEGAGVAYALSSDGGDTFQIQPLSMLERPNSESLLESPTLARAPDDSLHIAYIQRSIANDAVSIRFASSTLGPERFSHTSGVAIWPAQFCPPEETAQDPCWDAAGIASPDLRFSTSDTGSVFWRLTWQGQNFEQGLDDPLDTIGFAASSDGIAWSPYPFNPGLTLRVDDTHLRAPAFHQRADGTWMLYAVEYDEKGVFQQLSVALNTDGAPSETLE